VAIAGDPGTAWLGHVVERVEVSSPDGLRSDLDCLLIAHAPGGPRGSQAEGLAQAARGAGIPVVAVVAPRASRPEWAGLADLELGAVEAGDAAMPAPPPFDPATFNPLGFRQSDVAGLAAIAFVDQPDGLGAAGALMTRIAEEEPVVVHSPREVVLPGLPAGVLKGRRDPGTPEFVRALHANAGVIDHPAFHRDAYERAGWLLRLAAAGVPIVALDPEPELRTLLGDELADALERARWEDLLDLDLRERISVAQRRPAHREHTYDGRWRRIARALSLEVAPRPLVSVILSTRRSEWLEHALSQVERQTYEPKELVVCLHGDDFPEGTEDWLRRAWNGRLVIEHVDSELVLGDALNQGVEAASGEYVTKMDDDDPYSVDHIWDLVLAAQYSDADLVGKAAEFVYLEEIDLTIRRFMGDVEMPSRRLAGGGMMARREPLRAIGGWPSRGRGEDTALVRTFDEAGRRVHRTHGFGYILNRHGRDHTWRPQVDYFLVQSEFEWRGLRYDKAGIY
jgi:hypothetical protein